MRNQGWQGDLANLVVPEAGRLARTGNAGEPYRLLDANGAVVEPVSEYFAELQAAGSSTATVRSYGNDLLRWWRFLYVVEVPWSQATRVEARDFMRWMLLADKPVRPHWRHRENPEHQPGSGRAPLAAGSVNPVTGKAAPGRKYSAASRAHAETVLRAFYDFHLEIGSGPIVNPFPLDRSRPGRANAHHNPMEPFTKARKGRYRPKTPKRIPRRIPDDQFDKVFAGLKYHRDRALLAFWVSTGARAEELLTVPQQHVDPGEQLVAVIRKGSQAMQWLPASPDAFVWLRLYQEEIWRRGAPRGPHQPLWFTLRRPWRPLNYHAARAMFVRVNELLGSNWTLHDLRHTAAWRMNEDPEMNITDVQWVLGHSSLTTTQLYTLPSEQELISNVLRHHQRRADGPAPGAAPPAAGYNPDSLDVLFGRSS